MKMARKLLGLKKKKKHPTIRYNHILDHFLYFCGVAESFLYKEPVIKSFKHQERKAPVQTE